MITGCLQQKNGYYYAVLYMKVDGKRKNKWVPTKLPVNGTSDRKARKAFDDIRMQYEQEEAERLQREEELKHIPPEARLPFADYMLQWLESIRPTIASTTYQSYFNLIRARLTPYFTNLGAALGGLMPQPITACAVARF